MILLQCSYGTKELELKNNLNTWLNLGFIFWKEKLSLLLSLFLVFCVLFDCYNILSCDFSSVSVVTVKVWDTTISLAPCPSFSTWGLRVLFPGWGWWLLSTRISSARIFTCVRLLSKAEQYNGRWNCQWNRNERQYTWGHFPHERVLWILALPTLWVNVDGVWPSASGV